MLPPPSTRFMFYLCWGPGKSVSRSSPKRDANLDLSVLQICLPKSTQTFSPREARWRNSFQLNKSSGVVQELDSIIASRQQSTFSCIKNLFKAGATGIWNSKCCEAISRRQVINFSVLYALAFHFAKRKQAEQSFIERDELIKNSLRKRDINSVKGANLINNWGATGEAHTTEGSRDCGSTQFVAGLEIPELWVTTAHAHMHHFNDSRPCSESLSLCVQLNRYVFHFFFRFLCSRARAEIFAFAPLNPTKLVPSLAFLTLRPSLPDLSGRTFYLHISHLAVCDNYERTSKQIFGFLRLVLWIVWKFSFLAFLEQFRGEKIQLRGNQGNWRRGAEKSVGGLRCSRVTHFPGVQIASRKKNQIDSTSTRLKISRERVAKTTSWCWANRASPPGGGFFSEWRTESKKAEQRGKKKRRGPQP